MVDLSGTWRAAAADEGLRRDFPAVDFDDDAWAAVDVPGHWRSTPAFAEHDGPLLYRRRFDAPAPGDARRAWLTLDGLFYQGDVWLDGGYVGDTEGYFVPHTFEVTDALRDRAEHVLAVEVTCTRQSDRTSKRNLTGVFQHWDCLDPEWNPGGIWRPVRVSETGPVRIAGLRVLCRDASPERAVVRLRAVLDAADAVTVTLRTRVDAHDQESEHPLAAGENRIEWDVVVPSPRLWWPHALGDAVLVDVAVDVVVAGTGDVSDARRVRTGLRQVRMDKWILRVNGERLFLKGSNQGPARMALADATADDFARDVTLAKDAGLDFLRVHAHVSRPELYDAADAAGLLLWQDMPLQWGYARGVRKQAVLQARAAVDLLGHHPSVFAWCGHNEPLAIDTTDVEPTVGVGLKLLALQQLPTWNKSILDGSIKRALHRADPTRPVIPHSGVLPHPGSGGTDSHFYFGWYHGNERQFPKAMAAFPRLARFVTEFGAQAVPNDAAFMEPERWPDLDWSHLAARHSLQKRGFDTYVPPVDHPTFESWRTATQTYQAEVVRHHVETLRRLKYRPTGGFAQFCFADSYPSVTWSVLDAERNPKAGYRALADACAPVIVVADRPAESYRAGDPLALDVHVVSDLRVPLTGGVVTARLSWAGGSHEWQWTGDVDADACVRIGTIQAVAPDAPGDLVLDLSFEHDEVKATNRYVAALR
jgi:beta-mannosidase